MSKKANEFNLQKNLYEIIEIKQILLNYVRTSAIR